LIAALGLAAALAAAGPVAPPLAIQARTASPVTVKAGRGGARLDVPLIRQTPEHCGPAALQMVMRYNGAGRDADAEAERTYDPVLRGALVTEMAIAARRVGFEATIETLPADSLIALLNAGVPPIVLYSTGFGPVTRAHYAVVVGWEPEGDRFVLHDGSPRPRRIGRAELERRRRAGDDHVLILRRGP
jgi:hypothetical protein